MRAAKQEPVATDTTQSTTLREVDWVLIASLAVIVLSVLLIVNWRPRSCPRESAAGMTKQELLAEFGEPDSKSNNGVSEIWHYEPGFFNTGAIVLFGDEADVSTEVIEDFSF